MSIRLLNDELSRFLRTPTPEVMCITGKWGVGKTHAWRDALRRSQERQEVALDKYSYVSLFGQNSLDDVRASIVEGLVDSREVNSKPSLQMLSDGISKLKQKIGNTAVLGKLVPSTNIYVASIYRALYMMLSSQIVCIDDLERAGGGLALKDIFGLASSLKEDKKCKVVMLLNQDALEGQDAVEYRRLVEKTADIALNYAPSSLEAISIGLDEHFKFHAQLSDCLSRLEVTNIRIIKKAQAHAQRAVELLKEFDERLVVQAVRTCALATYSHLQPDDAPPLSFIRGFHNFLDMFATHANTQSSQDQEDPKADGWKALLRRYDFQEADLLDLALFNGVEQGYFEKDQINSQATLRQEQLKATDRDDKLSGAWDLYRDSFDDNAIDIRDAVIAGVIESIQTLSPMNLSSSVMLLKDLEFRDDALALIDSYLATRVADPSFWDLTNHPFGNHVVDSDVRERFARKHASAVPARDATQILRTLSKQNGLKIGDAEYLASLPKDDFKDIFHSLRGRELNDVVAAALRFKNMGVPDDHSKAIAAGVIAALQEIAAENAVNARRVKGLGIPLPKADSDQSTENVSSGDTRLSQ